MKTRSGNIIRLAPFFAALIFILAAVQPALSQVFITNLPMVTPRYGHTATLLPNGKVLVAGGQTAGPITNLCELYDPATGSWTNTGPMITARNAHAATLLPNGKVLVMGGKTPGPTTNLCELYDPATGTWTNTGAMSVGRQFLTATLLPDGKVLAAGGISQTAYLSSSEIYNPINGVWTNTGTMNAVRGSHCSVLLTNGLVLAIGGYTGAAYNSSSETYDPSNGIWTLSTGSMTTTRQRFSATVLPSGKVLVAGGGGFSGWIALCELYDPVAKTWTTTGSMVGIHGNHTAVLMPNGMVLMPGGYNNVSASAASEIFNPASGTWASTASMISPRYLHAATVLANGKVLITGGYNGSFATNTCELFEITNATWTVTNTLNVPRNSQTATVLTNGKVLVTGGQNAGGGTNGTELFDPSAGTWTSSGSMATTRSLHTATLLGNGLLLVAGGQTSGGGVTNGAELYDAGSGTWANTSALNTARHSHTATALADGRVLVAGGQGTGGISNNAELYFPASGTWTNTGSLLTARKNHSATLLPNGKVLVVGGTNNFSGTLPSAELFDPAVSSWTTTLSPGTARSLHTATLLPSGSVLVAGGYSGGATNGAELYNPTTGTWTNTGAMTTARFAHTATLLLNGKVLVSGGTNSTGNLTSAELYDPANGIWTPTKVLNTARSSHSATLLINGKVLLAGGFASSGTTNGAELYDVGLGFTNTWQPQVTNLISPMTLGSSLSVGGFRFRGISGANCGNAQDSPSDYPVVQLRSVDSGQVLFPLSTNWSTNTFVSSGFTNFPTGFAYLTVFVNGIPSTSSFISITKQLATVTLGSLAQTYDGFAKNATATTTPFGLTVNLTYNGSSSAPTNVGSYTVIGSINDLTYQGGATNTLVISKAAGSVFLSDLTKTYDGTAKPVTNYFTSPGTYAVNLTYNGSANAPTNAGTYTVVGLINDTNYFGGVTNTLTINKATATVTITNLLQTYDGSAKTATITTTPPGLTVTVTYNAFPSAPTNAGNYTVSATINDTNYQGNAFDTLVINKATAVVTLGNLAQTYDGTFKSVTVTTTPTNLLVNVTYDGSPAFPVNAGSYVVVGIVSGGEPNYQGSGTNTLVIAKATASVTLSNLSQTYNGTARIVTAGTLPTNLPVNITYNGSATAPTNAGNYTIVGTINHTNYQGSATDTLVVAKIPGSVTLGSLSQTYNGTARTATATTSPTNLAVSFTYNGLPFAPTNVGSYTVIGTLNDVNYFGGATNALVVSQAQATVTLGSLAQTYNGTARVATATTSPTNLTVIFTYNGSSTPPTNTGSYTVIGLVSDLNYFGGATNTLVVSKAPATVTLGNLAPTYDGTGKSVSVTTAPTNLTVNVTYNGSSSAPTNAGSYTVIGLINEANYFGGATNTLVIGQALATVTLSNLAQTYDGTAKSVSVTTAPTNLTVNFTYNGSSSAPTNAGSYTVVGTINNANYFGGATNTLVISKATATVTLGSLAQTYDGTARLATATTSPTNLTVNFTYNGSPIAPTNAGSYAVVCTVTEVNYAGDSSSSLVVSQAAATVTLGSLAQTYNGTARSATAITSPTNLTVNFTYNGSVSAPTNAGSYTVVGLISDVNYFGGATNTLGIGKATATVTLGSLSPTYDGTARIATATTAPTNLTVNFIYNGSASAPTNAGSYTVIGTVNDANYQGSATNTLVVAKAAATVTLGSLSQTYDGTAKNISATTSPTNLLVNFTYNGSSSAPTNAGSYTAVGLISDVNYFGGATNTLVIGKATATVTLGNLSQTYDGTGKNVSVTTAPTNLTVNLAYNGLAGATNAGSYTVIGTVSDANYLGGATNTLVIGQALATVTLGSLAQTYNGTARSATATTTPNGLTVNFTYNGSVSAPTNAGSYTVIGLISDANYFGGATNTLVISKAPATVTLGSLSQTYDGTARSATATTTPNGLTVNFTYNGSPNAPTNAGSYTVAGIISDVNYFGGATNTLVVNQAAATVTLGSLSQTYNGSARTATATTTPNGLTVNFTYNGSPSAPTNAASYTVIGTISDVNYFGGATNTLVVGKATATVTLGNLLQTYDGTARSATATTSPTNLTVNFTYNGSPSAPTNAGSYTVVGTISAVNYLGAATNTLVVGKAPATVTFGGLSQTYNGTPRNVSATTAPTNLTVIVTYDGSTNAPVNVGSYTVIGLISEANYFGGATNTLVINCPVITVGPATFPNAILNTPYNRTNTASGGSVLPYTFTIPTGSPPTGLILSTNGVLSGTPTVGGTFNFTVQATDANGCFGSRAYTIIVAVPPAISVAPSDQTILPGGTATLTVSATGTGPLTYQWQLNGTNIAGATGATLNVTNVSAADAGHYTVTVSNSAGSVTSNYAILTVWGMNFYPVVTLNGHVGDQYRVDYVEELNATNWNVLGYVTLPFSPYFIVDTNSPGANKRFYRVVLP